MRNFLVFIGIALILAGGFYGTIWPLYGAYVIRQSFDELRGPITLAAFKETFTRTLEAGAPVGETETRLRLVSSIDQIVKSGVSPAGGEDILRFGEAYVRQALDGEQDGRYVDTRLVFALAALYADAGAALHRADYLGQAERLYRFGLTLAPKRPEFLFGLFGLYRGERKDAEARALAETIIRYWPSEGGVRAYLAGAP